PHAGQSRLHSQQVQLHAPVEVMFRRADHTRTDKTHLAKEDIEQLRQFIETGPAQQLPNPGNARIVLQLVLALKFRLHIWEAIQNLIAIDIHRAELESAKWFAADAKHSASIEYWPRRIELDQHGDHRKDRQ